MSTPEAATLVVSPIPGVGDYTLIQSALDNLPAEGGYILAREGTYNENLVYPDKPVALKGCGRGNTILNIGSADGAIGISAAFQQAVSIRDLSIVGDPAHPQKFLSIGAPAEVLVENVDTTGILTIVENSSSDSDVTFRSCKFNMPNAADWSLWNGLVSGGELAWEYVEADIPHISDLATVGDPDWSITASYAGGGPTYSTYAIGELTVQGFRLDNAIFLVSGSNAHVVNLDATEFRMTLVGSGHTVTGSRASCTSANPIIDMQASLSVIAGCIFSVLGGASPVIESGGADGNRYDDNVGFSGSTITGTSSVINGSRSISVDGTTTNALVQVVLQANQRGLLGIGTIVNTDAANSLSVKETVTDSFGVTASVTTPIPIGVTGNYMLDPQTNFGAARPPLVSYKVEVIDTVSGDHADFSLRFTSQEAA